MPVEIRELVIKTTIVEDNSGSGKSTMSKDSKEEIISECVEEVIRILNEKEGTLMSEALTKLRIEAYRDIECTQFVRSFEVMFNPSTYSQKYEVEYESEQGAGTTGNTQKFGSIKPKDYSFEFLIDGTGASAEPVDVAQVLDDFLTTTVKMDGEIHRPPFLKLVWGDLISTCVLKSADISYNLFKPDGKPLRIKINASFSENIPDQQRVAEEGKSSPDLTRVRIVNEGDYLPLMADLMYNDHTYYIDIAEANKLNNFRKLNTGRNIKFPPLVNVAK